MEKINTSALRLLPVARDGSLPRENHVYIITDK